MQPDNPFSSETPVIVKNEKVPTGKGVLQFLIVLLFILATYSLTYVFQLSKEPPKIAERGNFKPTVEVARLVPVREKIVYEYTGEVRARNFVTVTPEVSGRAISVSPKFRVGEFLPAGSLLFTIDQRDYQAALSSASASLEQARANVTLVEAEAKAAVTEWKLLYPERAAPENVAKKPQLAQAQAAISVAKAGVETARLNLARTEYRIPFAGYVTAAGAEVGQYVRASADYGQILPLAATEITAEIDYEIAERLKRSGAITAVAKISESDGEIKDIPLQFFAFAPVVKAESRLLQVIFTPLNASGVSPVLLPGMFVSLEIREGAETLLYRAPADVPEAGEYVRILDEKNRVRRVKADILSREGDEILLSLPETGKVVAVRGAVAGLSDGSEVEIYRSEIKATPLKPDAAEK